MRHLAVVFLQHNVTNGVGQERMVIMYTDISLVPDPTVREEVSGNKTTQTQQLTLIIARIIITEFTRKYYANTANSYPD